MIRLLFVAAPLLALAACASDGVTATGTPTASAQGETGQKMVCEREQRRTHDNQAEVRRLGLRGEEPVQEVEGHAR